MKKMFLTSRLQVCICLLSIAAVFCQCSGVSRTGNGMIVEAEGSSVRIDCYTPGIVRIQKLEYGKPEPKDTSLCVILKPEKVKFRISRSKNSVALATDSLQISVSLPDGTVSFESSSGKPLLKETACSDTSAYPVRQTFTLDGDEAIYGLGQHRYGKLNWRGETVDIFNRNMDISIPVIHSVNGWGLYWDNTSRGLFHDSGSGMTISSEEGGKIDYYFIWGGNADGVIRGLHQLSGCAPMNALWSYGFIQSKCGYFSWEEMAEVVRKHRALKVPLDAVVLDYTYVRNVGEMQFTNGFEINPKAWVDSIHAMNAHLIMSIWPKFTKGTEYFDRLAEEGHLIPSKAWPDSSFMIYDAFSERAREVYWSGIRDNLYPCGIDGWWLDATEPEFKSYYVPTEKDNDVKVAIGRFGEVQLAYPMFSSMGIYEHLRELPDDRRVFILTRSGTFGQQRYAAQCWSGDTDGEMPELRRQIPAALNYFMSGLSYWNGDIGGFFCDYPGGNSNPEYRDVYARWFQFATFESIMRSHGMHTPREIYRWGEKGDIYYDNQEKFITLRYRLMPYTYSLAREVNKGEGVFMRPLFMDWPKDTKVWNLEDEFLYGRSILAAPVTSLDSKRKVYLPPGGWFDFWTGERLDGGLSFNARFDIDDMPVFVREGSIIPVGPSVQYASEKPWDNLQIRIYEGADAVFDLYEDAGDGYGYENGEFTGIHMHWDDAGRVITFGRREGSYDGMLQERDFNVVLVRPGRACGLDNLTKDVTVHYKGDSIAISLGE